MPRALYAPLADALCEMVGVLDKIATDIRLGARGVHPIYREPFSKKQKRSSAMPHKRNPINSEQIEGMARLAAGFALTIRQNIKTWEERAIEQSCVERVAWPDLFHVTVHSLVVMNRVLSRLVVYPDNMQAEVIELRGCYASAKAKSLLREMGLPHGLTTDDAYRIVQLAAFNLFEVTDVLALQMRQQPARSIEEAERFFDEFRGRAPTDQKRRNLKAVIEQANLVADDQLEASIETVHRWNGILREIFKSEENKNRWKEIFRPSYLLRNESTLFKEILSA